MLSLLFVIGVLWSFLPMILTAILAGRKGRNVLGWLFGAFFLGWIAFLILAFLKKKGESEFE